MEHIRPADRAIEPTPRWVGVAMTLLGLAAVAGVVLWVAEPGSGGAAELSILRPADGAEVTGPVELVFQTDAPLELGPRGWMADDLHLHASLDERDLMPAAADIEPVGTGRFRWLLPAPGPGAHVLRLYWSDLSHRALDAGASAPVTVQVPGAAPEPGG